ncbi:hypothetical protein ACFLYJ_01250 [Candidatus Cloacimonadota bacterium]
MKRILLILVLLIIILAVLLVGMNRNREIKEGIVIRQAGIEQTIILDQIFRLQTQNFTTARGDSFSGYSLKEILNSQNIDFKKYLVLFSTDGGSLRLNADDIANAYFIIMDETEKPSFRLIIPTDEFGQRWMKYVKTIEVH